MSTPTLVVHIDGELCGRLSQTSNGDLRFAYDDEYRARRNATPLSLSMPLSVATHRKKVIRPFLEGLLTDKEEALSAEARRYGVSPHNPFAILEHIGRDVAGALQILPENEAAADGEDDGQGDPLGEAQVSEMLTRVVAEYTEGAPYSTTPGRFSLAGAQPKIALHKLPDGSWARSSGSHPTTHILKPVTGSLRRVDVVEQMTLHAARNLGNEVALTEVQRIGEWDVLVSTRYDRRRDAGGWRRLHQEDLCQALGVPPAKKYQDRDGGPGVHQIAQLIATLPRLEDRAPAGERFFRALVFNVVAGCTDAHAKNYSLMLSGSGVRLAPLYDLLTYAAYWDGETPLRSAMAIGGEYALNRISGEALIAEGKRFGLGADDARAIVETTRSRMLQAFGAAGDDVTAHNADAASVAEDLLTGLRKLPLVID